MSAGPGAEVPNKDVSSADDEVSEGLVAMRLTVCLRCIGAAALTL